MNAPSLPSEAGRRRRLSIPTRIFVGFALVITAFASAVGVSVVQHAQSARSLRLMHAGFLPLSLLVGEARATQLVFVTLLDRVLRERDTTATLAWLVTARRLRPATVRRALVKAGEAQRLASSAADRQVLRRIERHLAWIDQRYRQHESAYAGLSLQLERGNEAAAAELLEALRQGERQAQARLLNAWQMLQLRIDAQSRFAAAREQQAAQWLALLTLLAFAVGIAVTLWSQRLLKPLPRLQQRVAAVAGGDLSQAQLAAGDDEIGALSREFERMVQALAARDARLQEAAEEQQRLHRLREQNERLAAIGRWAAHITHEVRNPLSSIALNVELLQDELLQDELTAVGDAKTAGEAKQLLQAIQREIDRLHAITGEYLALAALPTPRREPEDIGELARQLAAFLTPEMQAHGVALRCLVEGEGHAIEVDEGQLRQALLNLLRNAREATGSGGHVQLQVRATAAGVSLQVHDDGPGIAPEVRARLFELFTTTKRTGTGLGLPLARQIIEAHGGTLRCLDEAEEGTTFAIWLPATAAQPLADHASKPLHSDALNPDAA